MAKSAGEASRAVERCYGYLLKLLPINRLVERLYSLALLSSEQKSEVDSQTSPREKIRHFLDDILIPGLEVDYLGHFDEMVNMMKESDDVLVKWLLEKLIPDDSTAPSAASDSSLEMIDFEAYKDVNEAFGKVFVTCQNVAATFSKKFIAIRNLCVHQLPALVREKVEDATDIDRMFSILAAEPQCCNWMNVSILKSVAIGSGSEKLQSLIENYTKAIYSKSLYEVFNGSPLYSTVEDAHRKELIDAFGDKYPDKVTVEELMEVKRPLANKMAKDITVISDNW